MCRDPHNPDTIELTKLVILELLRDSPGNQVARWAEPTLELLCDALFADLAFEADLDSTEDVWKFIMGSSFTEGSHQDENLVSWRIRQEL